MYLLTIYTHREYAHTYHITYSRLRYIYSTLILRTIYLYTKQTPMVHIYKHTIVPKAL